ncbi:DUF3667 domain-containing protein [Parerythrobacter jejuensis]|uniref:DUF3667 domain-containing protein n=1 Tax=Parerythrobacter jejuensis TaxID=795812 RepID=A0A845ANV0_9SPHN|nr:DUF3667 domain-containing protein [Parerythrobacter jejuensis]MXP30531.1 DUF3667 domain-containing protein [Parerythrobacter jejuensis]MXP33291.1 DUF3667 domain-containing protein [Parerythrobacter jejuensis]
MSGEGIEAVGQIAEGGLAARAVENEAGEGGQPAPGKGHFSESDCLNCGTTLVGTHCHSCGQKAHLHRTLTAFWQDLLHGALHFDGKMWRTLPKLFFKPGELTRRYIAGERARFVSPMALFLFSVFAMFAIFQMAGISTPTDIQGNVGAQIGEALTAEQAELTEELAKLDERLAQDDLPDTVRTDLQTRRTKLAERLEGMEVASDLAFIREGISNSEPEVTRNADGDVVVPLGDDGDQQMTMGADQFAWVREAIGKWEKNPGLMLYKLQTNFYKFSWLLIPISVPFVWLLFAWKRRFRAYDHAIFVTYSLSFMSLLVIVLTMSGLAGLAIGWVVAGSTLLPAIHIYKHLRGAYELSRFSTIWRLAVLLFFINVILMLFFQLLLLLGAF